MNASPPQEDVAPRVFQRRYHSRRVLGAGSMGEVHACLDRMTGSEIALKRLRLDGLRPDVREHAAALAHEFRLLASMRHENIIGVRSFGVDAGDPFFTMEIRAGAVPFVTAARALDEGGRVELLLQLLRALAYLERRGVVHRDLKPSNVLVDAGRVCLLDFGLAAFRSLDADDPAAGNLAYASPEVIRGGACTVASDLYAVGVMAYEVFAGVHPHADESAAGMLRRILTEAPDLGRVAASERVKATLSVLLAKDPGDRPRSALAVAELLVGEHHRIETRDLRESFLNASTMIGRDGEIARVDRLVEACLAGRGGALLLGGESGVGKSRLLEELRARALVGGIAVFEGGAVEEAASPYQVFQSVLLQLAVSVQPTPLEAAVLAHVVPHLADLVEVPLPSLLPLDPAAVGDRLAAVMKGMLARLEQPWIAVLEDLHWMASEDLRLLRALSGMTGGAFVGTYRSDERPDLPDEVGVAEVLRLSRLEGAHVETLARTMLGREDVAPELVEFLRVETQGNPFFMVEVLRALAEGAERLDRVDTTRLPGELFPDGVRRVLERRFARLPAEARALLNVAAIAGRALDLELLGKLVDGPVDRWVDACMDALVLETFEGTCRFAHDQLRAHVLEGIAAEERPNLHGRVAEAIEGLCPADRLSSRASALAFHYGLAKNRVKEADFATRAGEHALARAAYDQAISFLRRSIELEADHPAPSRVLRARVRRQLGQAYIGLGHPTEGRGHIEDSVSLLGYAPPASTGAQVARMVVESATQVRRRMGRASAKDTSASAEVLLEAARGYDRLAEAYFYAGDQGALVHASLKTLNLAEAVGRPTPELAMAYANITGAMGLVPWRAQAEHYAACAHRVAAEVDDDLARMWVLWLTSNYRLGEGRWEEAIDGFTQQKTISERVGFARHWEIAVGSLHWMALFQNRLDEADAFVEGWIQSASRGDAQAEGWALHAAVFSRLRHGDVEGATRAASRAADLLAQKPGPESELCTRGMQALVALRTGDAEAATALAEQVAPLLRRRPLAFFSLAGHAALTEVHATLGARARRGSASRRRFTSNLEQVRGALRAMTKVFPIAEPAALRVTGAHAVLRGDASAAADAFAASRGRAVALGMPHEVDACAQLERLVAGGGAL